MLNIDLVIDCFYFISEFLIMDSSDVEFIMLDGELLDVKVDQYKQTSKELQRLKLVRSALVSTYAQLDVLIADTKQKLAALNIPVGKLAHV